MGVHVHEVTVCMLLSANVSLKMYRVDFRSEELPGAVVRRILEEVVCAGEGCVYLCTTDRTSLYKL